MSFPLYHRPGTVIFLDDDSQYLEMLALVLPRHWHVRLYLHPQDWIEVLRQDTQRWEADIATQFDMIERWRGGKPLIPQLLEYWANPTRFALSRVCVVDYSMPAMDGLQALSQIADWPGSRVLLTGQADEQVAVQAFNLGLIDQFITKQTPDISRRLMEAIERLLHTQNPCDVQTWRNTLNGTQSAMLRSPSISRDLLNFAQKHWVEYVAIGEPFGVLGLDKEGQASWLQLEPTRGLAELAELAATQGIDTRTLHDIRVGNTLINLELRQALGLSNEPELAGAFPVGQGGQLLGAFFPIKSKQAPAADNSFDAWLTAQAKRVVQS
jgi:CheY-like chemotaxis protein